MKQADINLTFSSRVDSEEQAEEFFDEVIDNLNRSDYSIEYESVEEVNNDGLESRLEEIIGHYENGDGDIESLLLDIKEAMN